MNDLIPASIASLLSARKHYWMSTWSYKLRRHSIAVKDKAVLPPLCRTVFSESIWEKCILQPELSVTSLKCQSSLQSVQKKRRRRNVWSRRRSQAQKSWSKRCKRTGTKAHNPVKRKMKYALFVARNSQRGSHFRITYSVTLWIGKKCITHSSFKCNFCDKTFKRERTLRIHKRLKHSSHIK